MKYLFSRIIFGGVCLWATAASAAELALVNCEGALLASERLQEGTPSDVVVEVASVGDTHSNPQLTLENNTSRTPTKTALITDGKVIFSKVSPGRYRICPPAGVQIGQVSFGAITKARVTSFDLLAGLAVVGAGVGASEATRSGGSNQAAAPIELAGATSPDLEDIQVAAPLPDSSGSAATKPCSKNKGAVGTLGVNDCGAGLEPDPLSPYM
jgi:hypothetical protein